MGNRSKLISELFSGMKRRHSFCQRSLREMLEGRKNFYKESRPFQKSKVVYEAPVQTPEQVIDKLSMEERIKVGGLFAKTILEQPFTPDERKYRQDLGTEVVDVLPIPNYQLFKAKQDF